MEKERDVCTNIPTIMKNTEKDEGDITTRSQGSVGEEDITITHPGIHLMKRDIGAAVAGNASSEACCATCCSTHCATLPNMATR
jgi:hypothetical protein